MDSDQSDGMRVPTSFTVAYAAFFAFVGVITGVVVVDPELLLALA